MNRPAVPTLARIGVDAGELLSSLVVKPGQRPRPLLKLRPFLVQEALFLRRSSPRDGRAAIVSAERKVVFAVRRQPLPSLRAVERKTQPAHLVLDQRVEGVEDQSADGLRAIGASPAVGFSHEGFNDWQEEALRLARPRARGDDHRPFLDANFLQGVPLVGVEIAVRGERAARGELGELGREPEIHARLFERSGLLMARHGLDQGVAVQGPLAAEQRGPLLRQPLVTERMGAFQVLAVERSQLAGHADRVVHDSYSSSRPRILATSPARSGSTAS